jgi:hypothetical protein
VPEVDVGKVVEDALKSIADTIIISTLQAKFGEQLPGATPSINDALSYLAKAFGSVSGASVDSFQW